MDMESIKLYRRRGSTADKNSCKQIISGFNWRNEFKILALLILADAESASKFIKPTFHVTILIFWISFLSVNTSKGLNAKQALIFGMLSIIANTEIIVLR